MKGIVRRIYGILTGMGVKDFFVRKMIERQLKNVPEGQRALFMKLFEEDPKLFERIANEVKEKKKQGQDETLAAVAVMRKYQPEIQALIGRIQKKT